MPSDPVLKARESLTSKEIDFLSIVEFLGGLVTKEVNFTHHLDTQTNILVGISTALFALSASGFLRGQVNLSLLIVAGFSGIATLLGLLAIHPPRFMRKFGQTESIMFSKNIAKFDSAEDYTKELLKVVTDHEKIVDQFGIELYNLAKYYYRPKRILFRYARTTLLAGIALGLFTFFIEILFKTF